METTVCRSCGGIVRGSPGEPNTCQCGHAPATAGAKVCCECGKDLTGHTRYHDHNGAYWCRVCHEAEKRRPQNVKVVCEDCHKRVDATKVDPFEGHTLCGHCARERALDKSRPHRAAYRHIYEQIEQRRTKQIVALCLLVVLVVLALIKTGVL